jgi:hypothetical protein
VLFANASARREPNRNLPRRDATNGIFDFWGFAPDWTTHRFHRVPARAVNGIRVCVLFGSDKQPVRALAFMMRYFFHLEDGACIRDPKGVDFPDDASALQEAANIAQELSKARVHAYEWSVVVKNADGVRVGSVPLTPSLAVHAPGGPIPPGSIQ